MILLYKIITGIINTRAAVILKGVGLLSVFYVLCLLFNFNALLIIFKSLITLALFAIIVVFQPELRKLLESVGTKKVSPKEKIFSLFKKTKEYKPRYSTKTINELADACFALSQTKTGALIVIEKDLPLTEYSETGIYLNADITKELLINIFEKNTPLHDGAVIVVGDSIISATAYLPLSDNKSINKNMGTRHRAAIGVSEAVDCQVLVVSEENGHVSYVKNGTIKSDLTKEQLIKLLKKEQNYETEKKQQNLSQKIKHNFSYKMFSIIFAILSWIALMNVANPIISKTIDDVPISIINDDSIIDSGKIYEIVSEKEVSVIISGKKSEIDNIKKDDITVIGDVSKMSYVYAVPLTAYSKSYSDVSCSIKNNEIMTIKISDKVDKEFDLSVKTVGQNNDYFVSDFKLSSDKIIVSGTKDLINIIGDVRLNVPINSITENGHINLKPEIYDKNGSLLINKLLTTDLSEITVEYKVYSTKEIPLNITTNSNMQIKDIKSDFNKIIVAGTNNNLKKINSIDIKLDLNDISTTQSAELSKTIDISQYLPQNIYLTSEEQKMCNVTIYFDVENVKNIKIQNSDITLKNLDKKYDVLFEKITDDLIISGDQLDNITISDFSPYLDLSEMGLGEYNLALKYISIDDIKVLNAPLIKIKIIEKELKNE